MRLHAKMKPVEKRKSGMLVTASATAALAIQSAMEAVLPMQGSTSAARKALPNGLGWYTYYINIYINIFLYTYYTYSFIYRLS